MSGFFVFVYQRNWLPDILENQNWLLATGLSRNFQINLDHQVIQT